MTSRGRVMAAAVSALVVLGASALGLGAVLRGLKLQLFKLPIEAPGGLKLHSLPTSFPRESPRWTQYIPDEIASAEVLEELGTTNYITRWFRREPVGDRAELVVQFHAAYYTGMIDTVPHVPERCMVGGGLEIAGATELVPVPLDRSRLVMDLDHAEGEDRILMGRSDEVHTRVRLPRGVENLQLMVTPFRDQRNKGRLYAGYFFIANGGVVASANDVRLLAFRLKDDYAYYVKVQFLSASVESAEELGVMAGEMLDELFPELARRLPDWTEVQAGLYPPGNPRAGGRGNGSAKAPGAGGGGAQGG